jgi:hypothetical protein
MNYETKTRNELILICKEKNIKGYSSLKKDEIIQLLQPVPVITYPETTGITVATTTTNTSAGVSGTNANLPPYYALAYIMKG